MLLAAGELSREEIFFAYHLKAIERVANNRLSIFFTYVAVGKGQFEIFENRLIVEEVIALKNKTNVLIAQCCTLLAVELMDRHVVEVVLTGPRLIVHAENVQQGRLPCS